jgi:hypothetical protein
MLLLLILELFIVQEILRFCLNLVEEGWFLEGDLFFERLAIVQRE